MVLTIKRFHPFRIEVKGHNWAFCLGNTGRKCSPHPPGLGTKLPIKTS